MIQVVSSAFFGEARKEKKGRLGMMRKMSTKPQRPAFWHVSGSRS
jgi:hypothetical protein